MAQHSPRPHRRRALIVDDETSFGIRLEADMHALGYDVCDLATNGQQAFLLAMSDQPDVVLMDVCLEGGREGIEVARRLREVCDAAIIFVTGYTDRATIGHTASVLMGGRGCHSEGAGDAGGHHQEAKCPGNSLWDLESKGTRTELSSTLKTP
jgi:CheY-like chemotaxis protein